MVGLNERLKKRNEFLLMYKVPSRFCPSGVKFPMLWKFLVLSLLCDNWPIFIVLSPNEQILICFWIWNSAYPNKECICTYLKFHFKNTISGNWFIHIYPPIRVFLVIFCSLEFTIIFQFPCLFIISEYSACFSSHIPKSWRDI